MLVAGAVRVAVLAVAMLWQARGFANAQPSKFQLCGRNLSQVMSRLCRSYNSPWNDGVEHSAGVIRRRRDVGIADECCNTGCSLQQLIQYCDISTISDESLEQHLIAHRSIESTQEAAPAPPLASTREREVGGARARGYARGRLRCRCRRRRTPARRRARPILMGNMAVVRFAPRAAPVVGTVSPLITWGRTLATEPRSSAHQVTFVTV